MTGFAADICVLFTAGDAYMRDFALAVPPDCVAAETVDAHRQACAHIERSFHAEVKPSRSLRF